MAKLLPRMLTVERVRRHPAPARGRTFLYDAAVRGLAVQITPSGARTYYVVKWHAGKTIRTRIGAVGELSLGEARRRAAEELGKMAAGKSTHLERLADRRTPTLGQCWEAWQRYVKPDLRKATVVAYERLWKFDLQAWAGRRLDTIKPADVSELHRLVFERAGKSANARTGGKATANRAIQLLSVLFGVAADRLGYEGPRPIPRKVKFREHSRERFLSRDELRRLLAVLDESPNAFADPIRLLLFTGARRTAVMTMRWADLDLAAGVWTIPPLDGLKSRRPVVLPLSDAALEVLNRLRRSTPLDAEFVLRTHTGLTLKSSRLQAMWDTIRHKAGIDDVTLHDLRRTVGSWATMAGLPEAVVAKMLGHSNTNSVRVYSRLRDQAVRSAFEAAHGAMFGDEEDE